MSEIIRENCLFIIHVFLLFYYLEKFIFEVEVNFWMKKEENLVRIEELPQKFVTKSIEK